MLIEFRVANFRSFREEQVFSLVAGAANRDTKHPGNLIECGEFDLVKSAAIYGANASGKSNLLKAIRCMTQFVEDSATRMTVGDPIRGIVPFRLDTETLDKPSLFEMTIMVGETRYEYGFSATAECVHSEWLKAYLQPTSEGEMWIDRQHNPITKENKFHLKGPLSKEDGILASKTRDNGLMLSRGAELNIEPLTELYLWFRKAISQFYVSDDISSLGQRTAKWLNKNEVMRGRVAQMIRHADLGISGLRIQEIPIPTDARSEEPQVMLRVVREFGESRGLDLGPMFDVRTLHSMNKSDEKVEFSLLGDESRGTQQFFTLLGPLLDALEQGTVVIVDELESSMHSLLTRKLIELFQSPKVNKKGAQLVFTTHDSTLMDPELFRRDQMWIAEKNTSAATELFTLYDFDTKDRPRNTTAFQRNYLAGRYGGVPQFGPTFEDLEFE